MNNTILRIKKVSMWVFIGLGLVTILMFYALIVGIVRFIEQSWEVPIYDAASLFTNLILMLAVMLMAVYIFYHIRKAGTPFLNVVVKNMKRTALLVALMIRAPHWVHDIVRYDGGFTILEPNTFFAVLCGGIVFCFALVFEYGCVLQTENDETL